MELGGQERLEAHLLIMQLTRNLSLEKIFSEKRILSFASRRVQWRDRTICLKRQLHHGHFLLKLRKLEKVVLVPEN